MKNTKEIEIKHWEVMSVKCDVCGKTFTDVMDLQEMVSIAKYCGYASVFSDGQCYEIDICENCVKNLLGEYLRFGEALTTTSINFRNNSSIQYSGGKISHIRGCSDDILET